MLALPKTPCTTNQLRPAGQMLRSYSHNPAQLVIGNFLNLSAEEEYVSRQQLTKRRPSGAVFAQQS